MKTSVIIPVFNALKYTQHLLKALVVVSPPDQLVVIDNGSTDGTAVFLSSIAPEFPDCEIITYPINTGFARAMNEGLRHAKHDCIVLMNNDVKIITTDWLEEVRRAVQANPNTLIGANLITSNELCRTADGELLPYLAGWLIACSRQVVETLSVGGEFFDERFFAYYEDTDLSARALVAGLTLKTLESIGLYHFGGKTGFALPNQPDILKASRARYAEKWGITWNRMPELGE